MSDSFATPWTVTNQAPLSMGFPWHEYWSGLPFPSPGDLHHSEIKPRSPALAGRRFNSEPPGKARDLVKLKALFPVFSTHRIGDVHEFLFNEGLESVRQPFSLL